MLIKCPECGKEVSDKADVCIHCGCPIKRELIELNTVNNICCINGVEKDLTWQIANLYADITMYDFVEGLGITPKEGRGLYHILLEFKKAPLVFDTSRIEEYEQRLREIKKEREAKLPHCPTCNSTKIKKISATSKAVNTAVFGLFGTKRFKQWHCNNCGHEW